MKKSKHTLQVWQIAKVNLRHNFLPLILLSVIIMMLTPILFGTTNLDSKAAAVPIEMFISIIGIILLVLLFSLFMFLCGCEITGALICGTIADAMFLGAIGLLVSSVTNNLPVSFMIPLLYYVLNLTMKSKFGSFNLFAMMNGNYKPNSWLFITSVVFIIVSILLKRVLADDER